MNEESADLSNTTQKYAKPDLEGSMFNRSIHIRDDVK